MTGISARVSIALFVLLGVLVFRCSAADPVILKPDRASYLLGSHLEILADPKGKFTVEDVSTPPLSNRFQQGPFRPSRLLLSSGVYWIRFTIKDVNHENVAWVLELDLPTIDRMDLYYTSTGFEFEHKVSGDAIPFEKWDIAYRAPAFNLTIRPGQTLLCYVRLESAGLEGLPLTLQSKSVFTQEVGRDYVFNALFYVSGAVIVLYALFLWVGLRDRASLYFMLAIASYLSVTFIMSGWAYQYLWPAWPRWNHWSLIIAVGLRIFWFLAFTREFLNSKEHAPKLDKVARVFMYVGPLIGMSAHVQHSLPILTSLVTVVAIVLLAFALSLASFLKGYRPALYFLVAYLPLTVGQAVVGLALSGIIPYSKTAVFCTNMSLPITLFLWSLVLADRYRRVQKEYSDSLELKVAGRTRELNDTLSDLEKSRDELEQKVEKRTADLVQANDILKREIVIRKEAEEALREREERLRLAWETIPDALSMSRLDDGVYADVNKGYTALTGYERREIIGRSAFELPFWHNPADREPLVLGLKKIGYVRNLETEIRRKDGEVRRVLISAGLMMLDGESHVLALTKDIEDLKLAQEAVARSEESFRKYFELGPVGMALTSPEKDWVYVNDRICDMLGFTKEELFQTTWEELTHPDDLESHLSRFNELMQGKIEGYTLDKRFIRKDRSVVHTTLHATCVRRPDGEVDHLIDHIHDITERKTLEEQLRQAQKMEAIATLAGGLAHDLNNLLQVVLGYADILLLRKESSDKDYNALASIRQAALNGGDLIRRILTFSRKVETNPRPINLSQEVCKTETLLHRTIPKMIDIEMRVADDLRTINADPAQMEQVLLNLAVNARDAMPEGGKLLIETKNVKLREDYCRIHLEAQPGEYVLLQVSDTGHGMEKEVVERIFEPFYTTKDAGEGTGLGLAMVYGIVKNHGGYVNCYSEPGAGTSFKIYFPVTRLEIVSDVAITMEMPAFGTETILLVDDEDMLRDLGKETLMWAGYSVMTASNGEEALDLYEKKRDERSLVILDLIMPGMGGKACLEELVKIDPEVKVLVASGYSAGGPTKEAIEAGAKAFIDKPYDTKLLLHAVRRLLDSD